MRYNKKSDDDGRVEGTFNDFTIDHVVGKFKYGNVDNSEKNSKDSEYGG